MPENTSLSISKRGQQVPRLWRAERTCVVTYQYLEVNINLLLYNWFQNSDPTRGLFGAHRRRWCRSFENLQRQSLSLVPVFLKENWSKTDGRYQEQNIKGQGPPEHLHQHFGGSLSRTWASPLPPPARSSSRSGRHNIRIKRSNFYFTMWI